MKDPRERSHLRAAPVACAHCGLPVPAGLVREGDGPEYPVLTGDYTAQLATWESRPIAVGTPLSKPSPLFAKLDDTLGETGPDWAPIA